jgi:hypothetical protein
MLERFASVRAYRVHDLFEIGYILQVAPPKNATDSTDFTEIIFKSVQSVKSVAFLVFVSHAGYGIKNLLQPIFAGQGCQPCFHLVEIFYFFRFLFSFLVDKGFVQTKLNAHRLGQGRIGFAHVALEGQSGIRLFENISGGTGGSAKAAFIIFFSIDHVFIPAHALGRRIFSCIYGQENILQRIADQADSGSPGIIAAVFRSRMKSRTDDFTSPASIALIQIYLDDLDLFPNPAHFG